MIHNNINNINIYYATKYHAHNKYAYQTNCLNKLMGNTKVQKITDTEICEIYNTYLFKKKIAFLWVSLL